MTMETRLCTFQGHPYTLCSLYYVHVCTTLHFYIEYTSQPSKKLWTSHVTWLLVNIGCRTTGGHHMLTAK